MKNKRLKSKIWSLLLASALACVNTAPVCAASHSTSVTNHGKIGAVDIELHQTFPDEQVMIVPNQVVALGSSIENKGKPAWLRVKLEYPATQKITDAEDPDVSATEPAEDNGMDEGDTSGSDIMDTDEGDTSGSDIMDTDEGNTSGSDIEDMDEGNTSGSDIEDMDEGNTSGSDIEDMDEGNTSGSDIEDMDEGDTSGSDIEDMDEGDTSGSDIEDMDEGDTSGSDMGALQELDDSLITFASDKWTKIGPYYYLKEPVGTGVTTPFTESITFPSDWDSSMTNTKMGVVFTAEAIQEKNFMPDFDSDDPWHGAVIEAFDSDDYQFKSEGDGQFSIVYKGGSEGLVRLGDDFFANWGDLMPGDELDGTAEITNRMNLPVKIFFKTESDGDAELFKLIKITIKNGSNTVYDGPLSGNVSPAVLLKEYKPGESTKLSYHLSVPAEIDNAHALSEFKVVWTFSAEEVHPDKIIEIIKTGERGLLILFCILAAIICITGRALIRKERGAGDA